MRTARNLAPWLPWIVALVLSGQPKLALVAGLVTAVAVGLLKWHRGVLMWITVGFFAASAVAVIGLHNAWTGGHLGFLANGALAVGAWGSLLVGKPFTMDIARDSTDPSHWNHPLFIRINVVISAVWAMVLTVNAAASLALAAGLLPGWAGAAIPTGTLLAAIVFSSWYPKRTIATEATGETTGET